MTICPGLSGVARQSIRNALHILKTPGASEELVHQAHGMMERQVEHVVRVVDDLLDVSRIIRGKIELRKRVVDLAAVIQRALETAQPVIDAGGTNSTSFRIASPAALMKLAST